MKSITVSPVLLLAAFAVLLWAGATSLMADGQESGLAPMPRVELRLATREPISDNVVVDHDKPIQLLQVPIGQRFVLTDIWCLPLEDYPTAFRGGDRFWLLQRFPRQTKELLNVIRGDVLAKGENLMKLQWQTGLVVSEGTGLWVSYRFASDPIDAGMRVHYSGYYEKLGADLPQKN
ncbi:MAG: hypothetical protein HOM34_03505 [Planctomycetes bacterium]|jgi:hypothetical protein|nr:hypothetical protein [Planctomycetota bacterium]MBT4028762.1 hypothetical protein [Planctomycetota bacterium]MBT4560206.1 hypothetical protein [Planctomycetota bacterium]MBT5100924.1 hypothetical protein [Planctomycetota bacterium]MBT5119773.1 hypothetical protein [Planctomycetota bacterium]